MGLKKLNNTFSKVLIRVFQFQKKYLIFEIFELIKNIININLINVFNLTFFLSQICLKNKRKYLFVKSLNTTLSIFVQTQSKTWIK